MDRRPVTLRGLEISNKIHSTSIFKLQFMHLTPGPIKVLLYVDIKYLNSCCPILFMNGVLLALSNSFVKNLPMFCPTVTFFQNLVALFLFYPCIPINIFSALVFLVLVSLSCIFVILHYLLYVSSLRTALAIRKMPNRLLNFYVK